MEFRRVLFRSSRLERFLDTAFARELAGAPANRVHRALSFVAALPGLAPTAVEGEVDLLWETPEGEARAVVFLPGARPPRGLAALTDFLAAMELGARRLVREGVPVRVGLVFLGEDVLEPEFSRAEAELDVAAVRLRDAARRLAEADVRGRWPGREAPVCEGLSCGYVGQCHPRTGDTAAPSMSVTESGKAC